MLDRLTPRRRARWLAGLALALPVVALSAPYLFTSRCLYGIDFEAYYRPHAELARRSWEETGKLPLWNPHQYTGTPYLGNLQMNLYYPPNWLFLKMAPERTFGILAFLHSLLATWGMYRLARFFRLSRTACVLAGIAFGASFAGVVRLYAGHLPYFATQCQAPLLVYLLLRVLDRPMPGRIALLSGWIALVLLAGNPQYLYHLALLCAAVAGWRIVRRKEGRSRATLGVLASGVLGAAAASIHLLPAIEVARNSWRGQVSAQLERPEVSPYQSERPVDLLSFVAPRFPLTRAGEACHAREYWFEKAVYIGLLPFLLSLWALRSARRGPILFFLSVAAVFVLDGMASSLRLHALLSLLPGYGSFRFPARSLWVAVLCLSLLSAFGWEALAPRWSSRKALQAAAVLVTGLDLVVYGLSVEETVPSEAYARAPWYARFIGPERKDHRLLDLTDINAPPVAHGFNLLLGFGHPLPAALPELYGKIWQDYSGPTAQSLSQGAHLAEPFTLKLLNVKWIVSSGPPAGLNWKELGRDGNRILYEGLFICGLAFVEDGKIPARASRPSINRIDIECYAKEAGKLIVSESWMPGWRATLNGAPVPIETACGALMSVDVPRFGSRVTLEYRPPLHRVGKFVSAGALMLLGLLAILSTAPQKRLTVR